MRFEGAGAIAEFFATVPLGGRLDRIRLVPRRANRQPALAAYAENQEAGAYEAYGVMVFALDGERIAGITGFPRQLELFGRLGLPAEITQMTADHALHARNLRRVDRRSAGE
jgi:RNA polymerase sigma-70 factor (ECF subfamily)